MPTEADRNRRRAKPPPAPADKRGRKAEVDPPPQPAPGRPEPTGFLTPEAQAHWRQVVEVLDAVGLASLVDRDALTLYCSLWSAWREAAGKIDETKENCGKVITAPNGYKQINPWETLAIGYLKDMKSMLDQFGMTPKSRAKIKIPEPEKPNDKWSGFEGPGE